MLQDKKTSLVIEEMKAFRQHVKSEIEEEGYTAYIDTFKIELQKVERPAGVNFIQLAEVLADKIDENTELSDDAKELGKALYCLAAVELMGDENFLNWIAS